MEVKNLSFRENLLRLQSEHGETNYRLAKEIGVSQTSVKNWRDGVRVPHPGTRARIASHYGVTVGDLMKEE